MGERVSEPSAHRVALLLLTARLRTQVILDVVLPGVHGDELLPMIRQLLGDHVAVVACSALGELSLVQRCIFRGADSFMVKPLQIQSVAQLWQQCMARRPACPPAPPRPPARRTNHSRMPAPCARLLSAATTRTTRACGRTLPNPSPSRLP